MAERAEAGPADASAAAELGTETQCRALGLSVTQAARVVGQREQYRGFSSLADVDGIMGVPKSVKQTLKQHGSV